MGEDILSGLTFELNFASILRLNIIVCHLLNSYLASTIDLVKGASSSS